MSRILWKTLLISPAVVGATIAISSSAIAATAPATPEASQPKATESSAAKPLASLKTTTPAASSAAEIQFQQPNIVNTGASNRLVAQVPVNSTAAPAATPQTPAASPANPSVAPLDEVNRYSNEGSANNRVAQVTSVSQLSDVQPTDWAFQALQSLVERYGVIAGYPDGTFRGNRAMTRYEFAAGLNAALDRVNELIAAGTADLVRKEDLAVLQRLQEEFAAELATLRGRVDSLEAVTAELEANQFSTTTKLVGEVIAAVTSNLGSGPGSSTNAALQDRVRLDFQTSFTGKDVLHTRLAAGNAVGLQLDDTNNGIGAPTSPTFEGTQTFNVAPGTTNDLFIDWVAYDFQMFGDSRAYIAATGGIFSDFTPTLNPYFQDFDGGRGALSTFASESPIYRIGGGAGLGFNYAFGQEGGFNVTLGYLAKNANSPTDGNGLFNGDFSALGQLTYNAGDRWSLAATYVHAYTNDGNIFTGGGDDGLVGTQLANNPALLLNSNTNLLPQPTVSNSYGVEGAFKLSDGISLSAYGMYTQAILIGRGDGEIWSYGGGIAFPDLGKEGNLLGIFAGVQPTLRSLDAPGTGQFQADNAIHIEGFYRYQLTDNISITPGVIWLNSPGQDSSNSDAWIGTIRTTFNF